MSRVQQELRIGARSSTLAIIQAQEAVNHLTPYFSNIQIKTFITSGDKIKTPLYNVGGKGLFIKELEQALLDYKIDIAVHSLKDVPAFYHEDLILQCFLKREDPRDAFLSKKLSSITEITSTSIIGTSSFRRQVQLKTKPIIHMLRGNINTRVQRLEDFDGIILAVAGLKRANLEYYITEIIPTNFMLPAVGQGVICLQCRKTDKALMEVLTTINDPTTALCVKAERSFQETINGDCNTPMGAFAQYEDNMLTLNSMLATEKGVFYTSRVSTAEQAKKIGYEAAQELIIKSSYKS